MEVKIHESWKVHLSDEFKKPYFHELIDFVKKEYAANKVYPNPKNIFRAFDLCRFDAVKVVILGQDPYHGPAQANGLCFAVGDGVPLPPSLLNIYKEIEDDLAVTMSKNGNLESWARQGVLLLNATLTVRAGQAGSHQHKGWEAFTDAVIQKISSEKEEMVFLLWGRYAQSKTAIIDPVKHFILTAAHPSPFSANSGFFGCRHFSRTNEYLVSHGKEPIIWDV